MDAVTSRNEGLKCGASEGMEERNDETSEPTASWAKVEVESEFTERERPMLLRQHKGLAEFLKAGKDQVCEGLKPWKPNTLEVRHRSGWGITHEGSGIRNDETTAGAWLKNCDQARSLSD